MAVGLPVLQRKAEISARGCFLWAKSVSLEPCLDLECRVLLVETRPWRAMPLSE